MSALKVFKIVEKIEKLHTKKVLDDEKNQNAQKYYREQEQKAKDKYHKEMAYWEKASKQSVLSHFETQNELRDKHIALLEELNKATENPKGLEALKEVIERVRGYEYKDRSKAISLLKPVEEQ